MHDTEQFAVLIKPLTSILEYVVLISNRLPISWIRFFLTFETKLDAVHVYNSFANILQTKCSLGG